MEDLLVVESKDRSESTAAELSEKLLSNNENLLSDEQIIINDALASNAASASGNIVQGEKQPQGFRDILAALLFSAHVIAILYLAIVWGFSSLNYETPSYGTTEYVHFGGIFVVCILSSLASLALTAVVGSVMMQYVEQMVQISLLFTVICNALLIVLFILQNYWWGAVLACLFLAWSACYASSVWRRIPFCAANLQTAMTAVQSNGGLSFVAYGMVLLINVYSLFWMLAWLGVYVRSATCDHGACTSGMNGGVILLFLLSYYWTSNVITNMLHVVVSGVVGTWWFAPDEASTFCSPAIYDSFSRASTYSFGSVCLGSLLTAVLQVLYQLIRMARRHGRGNGLILCVFECLLSFLERLVAYFNKYAMVYVGLYGYDFLTAGKRTAALFAERGWTVIINDDLVARVLLLMSLVIGALTGAVGLLLSRLHPTWTDEFGSSANSVAFFLPFFIGTSMAHIIMTVVGSAVDTILVAFAEAPLDFERNHPGLHRQMVTAWRQVYPDSFQY